MQCRKVWVTDDAVESFILCTSGSTAAIAIVSATPVGKWENPGMSLGTTSMDPSVAVVVPSIAEKSEIQDNSVDVVEPLVSSTSGILGSPAVDNKLRLTTSVENASAALAIAKVTTYVTYFYSFFSTYKTSTVSSHWHFSCAIDGCSFNLFYVNVIIFYYYQFKYLLERCPALHVGCCSCDFMSEQS